MTRKGSAAIKCICSIIGTLRGWAIRTGSKASWLCVKKGEERFEVADKGIPKARWRFWDGLESSVGACAGHQTTHLSSRRQREKHQDWEIQVQGNEVTEELPSFREFPNSPWKAEQAEEPQLQWNSERHWVSRASIWETGTQLQIL